jgi:hypothetical protein
MKYQFSELALLVRQISLLFSIQQPAFVSLNRLKTCNLQDMY